MKSPHRTKTNYAALLCALAALGLPASAGTDSILVDLELSLVTDISGSVDDIEYNLQMDGYAQAFRNSQLHSAIGNGQRGQIAVNLIFFDDAASEGISWTVITNAADANAFADLLDNLVRPSFGGTNPAAGINLATQSIFGNNIESTRQVIDVSGDGAQNSGGDDPGARDAALAAGVDAINGLPILAGDPTLEQYYIDNIQGGRGSFVTAAEDFADFEASILEKLTREIGGGDSESALLVSSTLRTASISSARATTRDVGDRLFRMRAGRPGPVAQPVYAPPTDAKGGMASSKNPASPIVMPSAMRQWEVYGGVFFYTEDQDQQISAFRTLLAPESSIDMFGGHAGFEYRFTPEWTAGFAVSASTTDVDMNFVGNADIDTVALVPYVSYYKNNIFSGADLYADLMYAYGMTEYDVSRLTGTGYAAGSPDGDYNQLELTTGLNFKAGTLIHGPYASLRWLDGTIDSYSEAGAGGTAFPSQDYESTATNLGYQVSYPVAMGAGTLVPQARIAWEHEFEDDPTTFGIPAGEVDEDLAVVGVGVGFWFTNGWNVVADYEGRFGDNTDGNYVGLKAGYEF